LLEYGELYTYGSGNWGVLGHGVEKDVRFDKPQLVEYFSKKGLKVLDIALGEYHSFALTEDGNVYTWGYAGKKGFFNWMYT
jgi:alpha-tubulin suppressor-like RCC1 family protein